MANLNETDVWEGGIYQLEEDDPVLGGPTGIDNMAPRQLASRSRYQRLRNVTPWDATLTYPANVAYVSYGGTTWKSVGESLNVAPGADPAKWVRWAFTAAELNAVLGDAVAVHEAKANPHPLYATDADLTAHANAEDPHGQYVLAAGDSMTGPLNLVTPDRFDTSKKAVSAEFVRRQGIQANGFSVLVGTSVLDATHVGGIVYLGGAGNYTISLPLASTLPAGARIELISGVGASPVSIVPQSPDKLIMNANVWAASLKMALGDTLTLETNGENWFPCGGSSPLAYTGGFSAVMASSGYQKLPSGLILQWAPAAINGSLATDIGSTAANLVTFPIPFPVACVHCAPTVTGGAIEAAEVNAGCDYYDRTRCAVRFLRVAGSNSGGETFSCTVFAMGY